MRSTEGLPDFLAAESSVSDVAVEDFRTNRAASGISLGEEIEVELTLDEQPRDVVVPDDLAAALQKAKLREAFDALAYTRRRQHVLAVEEAKTAPTRQRRIDGVLGALRGD